MFWVLTFLSSVSAYNLLGCYTPQRLEIPLPNPVIAGTRNLTVEECVEKCSAGSSNNSIIVMQSFSCICYDTPVSNLLSNWSSVNPVECNQNCKDALPCGNINQQRFSIYSGDNSSTPRIVNLMDSFSYHRHNP